MKGAVPASSEAAPQRGRTLGWLSLTQASASGDGPCVRAPFRTTDQQRPPAEDQQNISQDHSAPLAASHVRC